MSSHSTAGFPQPVDAAVVPRFAGLPTFMRLPVGASPAEVDIALVGVPFDGGTTNRAGRPPRPARDPQPVEPDAPRPPRQPHRALRASPGSAICGDAPVNPIDLHGRAGEDRGVLSPGSAAAGAVPLTAGGDHLISLPILRGARPTSGPVGMIHFDAHSDTNDTLSSATTPTPTARRSAAPSRRACSTRRRIVQIGIRGSIYDADELRLRPSQRHPRRSSSRSSCDRGAADVMAEARAIVGDKPDLRVLRHRRASTRRWRRAPARRRSAASRRARRRRCCGCCGGVDIVGADVVEVSPPFDLGGMTALAGATMMFELLCMIAAGVARAR